MSSTIRFVTLAALVLFTVVQISVGALDYINGHKDDLFACDLRTRYGESLCAHHGVNSFRIWNREITLPGFAPMGRRDMPAVARKDGDRIVHAYPPWHVAFFYFYGWMPEVICVGLMAMLFGLCLYFVVQETSGIARKSGLDHFLVTAIALSAIAYHATSCFFTLNYGILILTSCLLMNKALERNHPLLAGAAWAVMMIKPQVGLLFFWPLFWRRRYNTIATAVAICLGATCATSLLVHESVFDLIAQVTEIGKPYGRHPIVDMVLIPLFGSCADKLWMGMFFLLVGVVTFLLRRRDFLTMCVPVVVAIPVWTYSQGHDRVILLIWFLALAGRMVSARGFDKWVMCGLGCFLVDLFMRVWSVVHVGTAFLSGREWMLYCAQALALVLQFAFVVLFIVEELTEECDTITDTCN